MSNWLKNAGGIRSVEDTVDAVALRIVSLVNGAIGVHAAKHVVDKEYNPGRVISQDIRNVEGDVIIH